MIPDCPGLSRHPGKPVTFTDSRGRVHDLTETPTLTYKEAADDPRLRHLGFASDAAVGELVRSGRLYPVFKNNPLRVYIFDPALTDFRHRALAQTPPAPR